MLCRIKHHHVRWKSHTLHISTLNDKTRNPLKASIVSSTALSNGSITSLRRGLAATYMWMQVQQSAISRYLQGVNIIIFYYTSCLLTWDKQLRHCINLNKSAKQNLNIFVSSSSNPRDQEKITRGVRWGQRILTSLNLWFLSLGVSDQSLMYTFIFLGSTVLCVEHGLFLKALQLPPSRWWQLEYKPKCWSNFNTQCSYSPKAEFIHYIDIRPLGKVLYKSD